MNHLIPKLITQIHKQWIKHETVRFLQHHQRLKALLAEIDRESESVGLSSYKYVSLYRMVRKIRPAIVLECGTGKSTFVIAQAMAENGNGQKLVSFEESSEWAAKQEGALDHFFSHKKSSEWFSGISRDMIELINSEAVVDQHRSWAGIRYADHIDYPYDFILVDGPALTDTRFINMDLIHVLKHFSETVSIWIDGRWAVAAMCRALFGDKTVHRPGWGHTEVYGATRSDLARDIGEIGREFKRMMKG